MIRKLKRRDLHYDLAEPFSTLTAPKPRSRFSSLIRTYRRINPMKHSPHGEQARLPLAAGRIAAAAARTVTIRHSNQAQRLLQQGCSVSWTALKTPIRLIHGEFLDAQCSQIACFALCFSGLACRVPSKERDEFFHLEDLKQVIRSSANHL